MRDVADVVAWLSASPAVNGVFNLGSGKARTFADLATSVFEAAGRKPLIEYTPMPESIRDKYQYFTQASMARLTAAGYNQPFTSLEDGVKDYVQAYLATEDPYR